jgi:orotidine-5'-phosphate decarboxylase
MRIPRPHLKELEKVEANSTEVCIALEPHNPSLPQRIMLALEAASSWIAKNWPILFAASLVALLILIVVSRR